MLRRFLRFIELPVKSKSPSVQWDHFGYRDYDILMKSDREKTLSEPARSNRLTTVSVKSPSRPIHRNSQLDSVCCYRSVFDQETTSKS